MAVLKLVLMSHSQCFVSVVISVPVQGLSFWCSGGPVPLEEAALQNKIHELGDLSNVN